MMRHAASADGIASAVGWSPEKVATFVLGHGETRGESHIAVEGPRIAFIPVPSVESRSTGPANFVGSIRRALIVVLGGKANDDLQRLARLLSGTDLFREGQSDPVALLSRIPNSDKMVCRYVEPATTWATVTPAILPGYDDPRKLRKRLFGSPGTEAKSQGERTQKELLAKLDRRIDFLLRKAIRQAGYTEELAQHAEIDWRQVGYWPGTELATRYHYPEKLRRFRRLHVRITWRDSAGAAIRIPGPLCLGGGRFQGLGLFASTLPRSKD
jgi:CRISPR-associated protein Csb2